ncbi:MAG: hypothetical protein MUC72_03210 [Acidobacteria bacterium]|nr:hypothetical protein [Acidobacteriota bacterium]
MIKIASMPNRRALCLGLFAALLLLAVGIHAQQFEPRKPNLTIKPDFEVVDIEFSATHRIFAKIRNNSPSPFSGNVEMGLQIAGYGLVYRTRPFSLNLPGNGQVVTMEMPCDVPAERMRMEHANAIGIVVGMDQDNKIPELNENNNTKHIEVPYGITSITLTLLPAEYQGNCSAATQVKISARIAFRCNLKVTEMFKIVLEHPSAGYRKEYRNPDFVVTPNPGTLTITKEILLPAEVAAAIQHGTSTVTLRVELFEPLKKMASNTATFTYRCL